METFSKSPIDARSIASKVKDTPPATPRDRLLLAVSEFSFEEDGGNQFRERLQRENRWTSEYTSRSGAAILIPSAPAISYPMHE